MNDAFHLWGLAYPTLTADSAFGLQDIVFPLGGGTDTFTPSPTKVFIPRVPGINLDQRLVRHTEIVSSILNSLIRKGQLRQVGPDDWVFTP